jgi:hypothetical protein
MGYGFGFVLYLNLYEEIVQLSSPFGMTESTKVAKQRDSAAKAARTQYEKQSDKKAASPFFLGYKIANGL